MLLKFAVLFYFSGLFSQSTIFPIRISETGRYFVTNSGKPFLYQADTPWMLFINLKESEMEEYMDIRIRQGFTVLQTTALSTGENINGDKPFENNDFSKPNLAYFGHLKKGMQIAFRKGLLVGICVAWKGCCGGDWNDIILQNGSEKCRNYGRFLGSFFRDCPNLFWIQGGDNDPGEHLDHYRQIALGILESFPGALQTYHAASGHSSTDVIPFRDNSWLNFSMTYTYFRQKHNVWFYICGFGELPEVYEMNHVEYRKWPVKPFILGESQYEGEDSMAYAPLSGAAVVRRQAYWSLLSGSCGHAYGSWCWKVSPDWRKVETDMGAWDMKHVKELFESIEWTKLEPDINSSLIRDGGGTYGQTDYVTAAISSDRRFALVYVPPTGINSRSLIIDMSMFAEPVMVYWFNPTNGEISLLRNSKIPNRGIFRCATPGNNGENCNDWVLLFR